MSSLRAMKKMYLTLVLEFMKYMRVTSFVTITTYQYLHFHSCSIFSTT